MKKRFWALFLAVMMVVSVLPTSAFAEEDEVTDLLKPPAVGYNFDGTKANDATEADIILSKTADDNFNGTYTVTLSVEAKDQILPKPTEVVFVLDASGSMNFCTDVSGFDSHSHVTEGWGQCGYNPSTEMCSYLSEHKHVHTWDKNSIAYCTLTKSGVEKSRWADATSAIESMKAKIGTENITYHYVYFKSVQNNYGKWDDVADEVSSYNAISPGGGTPLYVGVEEGIDCFTKDPMSNKVLIIVADGAADKVDGKGTYPQNICNNFKANAGNTIYTVGFTFSDEDFNDLASDGCDFTASSADDLVLAMDTISKKISGMIVDPMGDAVALDRASIEINQNPKGIIVDKDTGTINWSDAKGISGKVTLTYDVTVNIDEDEDDQKIPLNGDAQLHYTYTDEDGNEKSCSIAFPIPTVVIQNEPELYHVTYEYISGTPDKELPEDISVNSGKYAVSDDNDYLTNAEVNLSEKAPSVGEKYDVVENGVIIGTWTLKSWTPKAPVTVDEQDIKFTGIWEYTAATQYTVTYYIDDEQYGEEEYYYADAPVTVQNAPDNREGYTFSGWKIDDADATDFDMPAHNVIITGSWSKIPTPADLSVQKTVVSQYTAQNPAEVGDTIVWTITVTNSGESAGTFTLSDTLVNGTASRTASIYATNENDEKTGDALTEQQLMNIQIAGNDTIVYIAEYQVVAADKDGTLVNTASIGDNKTSTAPGVPVEKTKPNVNVQKVLDGVYYQVEGATAYSKREGNTAEVGDEIRWTITVDNTGDAVGTFYLEDTLSNGASATIYEDDKKLEGKALKDIQISTNSTKTYTAVYVVTADDAGEKLNNTVKIAEDKESTPKDPVKVKTLAKLSVDKKVTKVGETVIAAGATLPVAQVGDEIVWTITVKNEGQTAGTFYLEDTLSKIPVAGGDPVALTAIVKDNQGNVVKADAQQTIAGMTDTEPVTVTYTATYTVGRNDKDARLENTVTIADGIKDTAPGVPTKSTQANLTVQKEVFDIGGKEFDFDDEGNLILPEATIGDTITWRIYVTNMGDADGYVTPEQVADQLTITKGEETRIVSLTPTTNLELVEGKYCIAKEFSAIFEVQYTVKPEDKGATLINKVTLDDGDEKTKDPEDFSDPVLVENISVEKTVVGATNVKVGDIIKWTIKVTNNGTKDVTISAPVDTLYDGEGNKITDLTAQLQSGDLELAVNESAVFSVSYKVETSVMLGKQLINKAVVNGVEDSSDPVNVGPTYSISIKKEADKTSVRVGDKVTYTITATNTGNVDLTNVKITDDFLDGGKGKKTTEGTWSIDTLKPGESIVAKLVYTTVSDDLSGLMNSAVVDTSETTENETTEEVEVKRDSITPVGPSKPALNYEDHINYIIGYEDGFVRPLNTITRAEVATIFFRLLDDESRENFWSKENPFPDVTIDMWCNNAISTMFNAGIITGYPDGTFGPYDPVSRAEFATIAARFSEVKDTDGETNFLDLSKSYWAYSYIELAEELGWVQGYQGYFRPEDDMTRAEVMTTVNRVLKRAVEEDGMLKGMIEWPDNLPSDWFYEDVQEATNSHTYYRTNKRVKDVGPYQPDYYYEKWSELIENPDWAALERAWSDANDK